MRIGLTGTLATLVMCLAVSSALAQDTELATLRKLLESGSLEEKTESAQQLGEIGRIRSASGQVARDQRSRPAP